MDPDTNKFVRLQEELEWKSVEKSIDDQIGKIQDEIKRAQGQLLRPDGSPVPQHWSVFRVGEQVVIKNYTFQVAYIGESNILFEPVGPVVLAPIPQGPAKP